MVAKAYPEEKVGVFARRGGALEVVEYSGEQQGGVPHPWDCDGGVPGGLGPWLRPLRCGLRQAAARRAGQPVAAFLMAPSPVLLCEPALAALAGS